MQYAGKVMLAPMVRCGTLPLRLLSLRYGAHAVYSEELIDRKLLQTELRKTVAKDGRCYWDWVTKSGQVALRTCEEERGKLIVQLGTSDPDRAAQAAALVADHAAGVDVNCGCPKHFSLVNGMGAALLGEPDKLVSIIQAIRAALPDSVGVSAKIRLLDTIEETAALMRRLEAAGCGAIGLHLRRAGVARDDPADHAALAQLTGAVSIPVIANGDLFTPADVAEAVAGGAASVMLARGALRSTVTIAHIDSRALFGGGAGAGAAKARGTAEVAASGSATESQRAPAAAASPAAAPAAEAAESQCVQGATGAAASASLAELARAHAWGRSTGARPPPLGKPACFVAVRDLLLVAAECGNHPANTKYTAMYMLQQNRLLTTPEGQAMSRSISMREMAAAVGIEEAVRVACAEAGLLEIDALVSAKSARKKQARRAREAAAARRQAAGAGGKRPARPAAAAGPAAGAPSKRSRPADGAGSLEPDVQSPPAPSPEPPAEDGEPASGGREPESAAAGSGEQVIGLQRYRDDYWDRFAEQERVEANGSSAGAQEAKAGPNGQQD